jgi:hypothetical protein
MNKRYRLEDLGVNGRIILKWIVDRLVGIRWTAFLWGRIGTHLALVNTVMILLVP